MSKLTPDETHAIRDAVQAEYRAKCESAEAGALYATVAVFGHLEASAARHITVLCQVLHAQHENAPVLAPTPPTKPANLIAALKAAAVREAQTAAIYEGIVQHTQNSDLKGTVRPLWLSVSHLHLTAISDQLDIEQDRIRQQASTEKSVSG